jgi:hypothetical protein
MRSCLLVLVLLHYVTLTCDAEALSQQYVGSQTCQNCHQVEHQQWQTSDHHKAMQAPNAETVLGNFSDTRVEFHNIESRFFYQSGAILY